MSNRAPYAFRHGSVQVSLIISARDFDMYKRWAKTKGTTVSEVMRNALKRDPQRRSVPIQDGEGAQ